ncbi:MAG: hypothetical protein Tsb002_15280 [Wenzhouxiangellaceae bacterium]
MILFAALVSWDSHAETIQIDDTAYMQTTFVVGAGQPSISVCDCNSDGGMDVIISNYLDNNIIVYAGDGQGNLIESGRFPAGERPTDIDAADINGDGFADIAVANHETSYVTLLLGDGRCGFEKAAMSPIDVGENPHPHMVQLKDLDGDKISELIVDSRDNNGLLVMKGLPEAGFNPSGKIVNVDGDPYRGFAVNDIDNDGALDLVSPNQRDVGIALNAASDGFEFALTKIAFDGSPFAVELADITGDHKLDLLVATNTDSLSVLPGDGNGLFDEKSRHAITTAPGAKQMAIGDFNGDDIEDALVSSWSGELIVIIGGKDKLKTYKFEHAKVPNPWGVALADLNGDGKDDMIIADGDSNAAVLYVSKSSK